jgi:uncharacterized protein (TIGR02145 family)
MKAIKTIFLTYLVCGSFILVKGQQTVKDFDGNVYRTIKVGNQVWMAENLKVTHYRSGEVIPGIKEQKQWDALTSGAVSGVGNDPATVKALGLIYNWYAIADQHNVCPVGWHVSSETEWIELLTFLAGEKLSPTKTSAKIPPQTKSLNESLFKNLPVDYFRGYDLDCSHAGYGGGGWWTSTSATPETAYYHSVNYDTASKNRKEGRKRFGYNIRCIKSEL